MSHDVKCIIAEQATLTRQSSVKVAILWRTGQILTHPSGHAIT